MNNNSQWLLLCIAILVCSCSHFKRKSDLIANYEERETQIREAVNHFESIMPNTFKVKIRFKSSDEIDLEIYEKSDISLENELVFRKWNIDIDNYTEEPQTEYDKKYNGKTNSFNLAKQKLKWTNKTIRELYEKLESAGCIGISNWEPIEIEYGYNAFGVYSYKLFKEELSEEQIDHYNDGCLNIYYKNKVVLSYGGGAIGMQCFEDYYQN